MRNPFKKKPPIFHEPVILQIADVKKLDPLIVDSILKGSDCDFLPSGNGPFGSVNNPIPVNGAIGELKYLSKLRGRTGFATFFHRIGSFKSSATNKPVDKYEIVCHDGTQWTNLYFDIYHPRRSNLCPEGFRLMPFNVQLKIDIPFAYGVDFFVSDFPHGLPELLEKTYGKAFSRRAKEWLGEFKFENPFENNSAQSDDKNVGKRNNNEETYDNSPTKIKHYSFMSGVINEILSFEKEIIIKDKSKVNNFTCHDLFDNKAHVKFMIERYLYLSALLKYRKEDIDLSEMNKYVISISAQEYKLSYPDTLKFFQGRIDLYLSEFEMLKELKHPHPGKILWCLYNPSSKEVSTDTDSMFESNYMAGMYLLGKINETFKKEYLVYKNSSQPNSKSVPITDEVIRFIKNGVAFLKEGEYEKALDCFLKAKSIDGEIEGLNAYILVSRFSSGEFDIENEYEVLFDSFTKEINKNLGIIELFEARAWLCYDILDYFPDLDKSKYLFYKTQSESDFSFCISLKPNNIEYYRSRALLFRDTKDFSKALQDINKAIDLSPRYSRNYKDRADILKSMGKLKDSLNDIQTAISLCEDNRWLREYQKIASQIIAMMEPLNKKCF